MYLAQPYATFIASEWDMGMGWLTLHDSVSLYSSSLQLECNIEHKSLDTSLCNSGAGDQQQLAKQ